MSLTTFLTELKTRNEALYWFGLLCFIGGIIFLVLSRTSDVMLDEVSAWYKPFKFAFSIGLYCWTMAWYCSYLTSFNTTAFSWTTIALLGFEIIYIALQASKGQRSHFNNSSALDTILYAMMGMAATLVTIYTVYIGVLFMSGSFPELPPHYLTAIRWSILIFIIFSFEGFVMGSRMSHTIGGPDGNHGIPVLNWSRKFGDPRIAHFAGMHALQLLPLLSWYVVRNTTAIHIIALLYLLLAIATLVQALNGKPLFPAG